MICETKFKVKKYKERNIFNQFIKPESHKIQIDTLKALEE